jgi:hypothetical protein
MSTKNYHRFPLLFADLFEVGCLIAKLVIGCILAHLFSVFDYFLKNPVNTQNNYLVVLVFSNHLLVVTIANSEYSNDRTAIADQSFEEATTIGGLTLNTL